MSKVDNRRGSVQSNSRPLLDGDNYRDSAKYLTKKIVESKIKQPTVGAGMTRMGYTKLSGAPSHLMIKLEGEKIWRRLMIWQFSNGGTCFVRVKGEALIVAGHDVPNY